MDDVGKDSRRLQVTAEPVDAVLELTLVREYNALLGLAFLLLGNRAEAEDTLHTSMEHAWRSRRQLRDPAKARAWVHRILVREARRRRGQLALLRRRSSPVEIDMHADTRSEVDETRLVDAIDRLPMAQRSALVLHHYAGFSADEVAELMAVPRETVRSRLKASHRALRAELSDG